MAGRQQVRYTIKQILEWADQYHEWYGKWPISRSGPIFSTGFTWEGVNTALRKGLGGLPGGETLSQLLTRKRRRLADSRIRRPDITLKMILEWADTFHARHGRWPMRDSGPVAGVRNLSWATVNRALRDGRPNLQGGSTLSKTLRTYRGTNDARGHRQLSIELVLKWAKRHHARTGRWPVTMSGPVLHKPDENWAAIDVAMRNARRGFPRKMSLSQLLSREFGDAYYRDVGTRRNKSTGPRLRSISVSRAKGGGKRK